MPKAGERQDLLSKCIPEPNTGCWLWLGFADSDGYGRTSDGGGTRRFVYAHRLAWERRHGAIPSGLTIDHKCRQPCCLNVDHMQLVTGPENQRLRWRREPKTKRAEVCWRGHALVGANRYRGKPDCVEFRRLRNRRAKGHPTPSDPAPGPTPGQVYGRAGGL